MSDCEKQPLIALWALHKTTNLIQDASGDQLPELLRVQRHYLALARKYGITAIQVADSLEVSLPHAQQLLAMGEEIG